MLRDGQTLANCALFMVLAQRKQRNGVVDCGKLKQAKLFPKLCLDCQQPITRSRNYLSSTSMSTISIFILINISPIKIFITSSDLMTIREKNGRGVCS